MQILLLFQTLGLAFGKPIPANYILGDILTRKAIANFPDAVFIVIKTASGIRINKLMIDLETGKLTAMCTRKLDFG